MRFPNQLVVGWAFVALLGCGTDEDPAPSPTEDAGTPDRTDVADTEPSASPDIPDPTEDAASPVDIEDTEDAASPADIENTAEDAQSWVNPNKPIVLSPAQEEYTPGGLTARYYPGASPDALPDMPEYFELEPVIDFPIEHRRFGDRFGGSAFSARFSGALWIENAGEYRVVATFSDGLRLTMAGAVLMDLFDADDVVQLQAEVSLQKGWYPLELLFERDLFPAVLRLEFGPVDGAVSTPGPDLLGYSTEVPDDAPPLTGTIELVSTAVWHATVRAVSSVPAVLHADVQVGDQAASSVSWPGFSREFQVQPAIAPGTESTVTMYLEDLWGRQELIGELAFDSPPLPDYQLGGLMGTYYQTGEYLEFETAIGQRLDTVIDMPTWTDGDNSGSWMMAMKPDHFAVRWEGALWVDVPGLYTMGYGADDGQRMYVDNQLIAHNWTDHGMQYVFAKLYLVEGWHPIVLEMYENGGAAIAQLRWSRPDLPSTVLSPANLGAVLPPDDGAMPEVVSLEVTATPGKLHLKLHATELMNAELSVTGPKSLTQKLPGPSTGFEWKQTLPEGDYEVTLTLTDLADQTIQAVGTATVPPSND